MEQAKKHLKNSSILVLLFAALHLIKLITEVLLGDITNAEIPEGSPDNILLITQIILLSIAVLFLIPRIYVGLKGFKLLKTPDASKGHIIWAIILLVILLLDAIDPAISIITQKGGKNNINDLISILLDATIYFDYIKHAIEYRKIVIQESSNNN